MLRQITIFVPHASDCFTDHMPHGDGLVAYGFVKELARRGHRVHVLSPMIALETPLPPNVVLHPIALDPKQSAGQRLKYINASRRIFKEVASREKINIIHQLNPVSMALGLGMMGLPAPIVLGNYIANWDDDADSRSALAPVPASPKALLAKSVRTSIQLVQQQMAARILVTTPSARTRLASHERFDRKIRFVHHGIDAERFAPPAGGYSEPAVPTVLFLTNLLIRKGIYTLLEAFEIVHAQMPHAKFIIGGSGRDLEAVKTLVATLPIRDAITFLGHVPRTEIPAHMIASTVYCLPSHGEPYGMSAIEAMACAKPIVVTQASGLGEITPPQGARHVAVRDAQGLAAALLDVLSLTPAEREKMGRFNRAYADATFSWKSVVDSLEVVYSEVLDNSATVA